MRPNRFGMVMVCILGVVGMTAPSAAQQVGDTFRDCSDCPEMVVVPSGSFRMGSSYGGDWEKPVHDVRIGYSFAVGKYEVTFGQWDACVSAGGCSHRPFDSVRGSRPVINVSWNDAQEYVRWLSRTTGERYRLLSEAEWEYVARAGTTTRYWWGNDIGRGRASCLSDCGDSDDEAAPVGSFAANGFGLHDVHGNVWEWVEDCANDSYRGAPTDGAAWTTGDCSTRVLRSGSFNDYAEYLRSANRYRGYPDYRGGNDIGFRVARTLP